MKRIRVLIFDDEEMIRNIFKVALQGRDYEILDYENPAMCPVYLEPECNCPFNTMCADIIITDIRMPEVNGFEFIKKQKEKGCKVEHIVMISAYAADDMLKEIERLGVKFLKKPFSIDTFLAVIDEFEANIDPNRELSDWA